MSALSGAAIGLPVAGWRFMAGAAALALAMAPPGLATRAAAAPAGQPQLDAGSADTIAVGGLRFRDHNHDHHLDPYEDWRLPPAARAADLLRRMTLEEKIGLMMHGTAPSIGGSFGEGTAYDLAKARAIILDRHVAMMVTRLDDPPAELARQNNALQGIAAQSRLGIPVTVSSDPRNYFQYTRGASVASAGFSKWPEALGFGAIGDPVLTRRFGDVVRREYRATGIRMVLGPQADLATEPRWPRINGTFGENADAVSAQVGAFVTGAQGSADGPTPDGILTVVKHWVGYGAAADEGFDSHNHYGRFAAFPGGNLAAHMHAFDGALAAHVAGIMPTYSILRDATIDGTPVEPVGAGFSHQLLDVALRRDRGYRGIILSDFAITDDCDTACRDGSAPGAPFGVGMDWGVEGLDKVDRFALGINAGLDQYGGTEETGPLLDAVRGGKVPMTRVDAAVVRLLTAKFAIGEFEHATVDPDAAARTLGAPEVHAEALAAQAHAMVLLENGRDLLPLKPGTRVFLRGIDPAAARTAGLIVVAEPAQADVAVVRTAAPHRLLHPGYMFGSVQHEGDLDFAADDPDLLAIRTLAATRPVVTVIDLDRPAILSQIRPLSRGLLADFGASDIAVTRVLAGLAQPKGHLPLELPSSMAAVRAQRPDVPGDSADPLYHAGYGLRYKER